MFGQGWHNTLKAWTEQRYGVAKQKLDILVKTPFERDYMTHAGRWEVDKYKQMIATKDGVRIGNANAMPVG